MEESTAPEQATPTNYQRYKDSMKKAIKKYYESHKNDEKYKEYNRTTKRNYYQNNPEYRERKKQQALERYYRLKYEASIAQPVS